MQQIAAGQPRNQAGVRRVNVQQPGTVCGEGRQQLAEPELQVRRLAAQVVGGLVAGYGKVFGMRVIVWGSQASRAHAAKDGYEAAASKEAFFAQADVLSLHLRLSDATQGIVRPEDLALMKPDALLVNTSRADLIAPGALEAALQSGRPGWAALDVFDSEPTPRESVLLRLPNVLATPHIGYVEKDSYERYFRAAFENVLAFANGTPKNLVAPLPSE